MPDVRGDVWIDRDRREVFDWLVEPEHQTVWQSELVEFEPYYEGVPDAGDEARGVVKVAGKRFEWLAEITEYEEGESFAFESRESPVSFAVRWWLEDDDGGTRLHYTGRAGSVGGVFGRLTDPIVRRVYGSGLADNFEQLKRILEEEGRP